MNWRTSALCAQTDWAAFFPDKGESPAIAKSICQHGTEAGAKRHYRLGERPCPSCSDAAKLGARERRMERAK